MKGALLFWAKKSNTKFTVWKKDFAFVLRLMMAHVIRKMQQYDTAVSKGIYPRSHPEWLQELYAAVPPAGDDDDQSEGGQETDGGEETGAINAVAVKVNPGSVQTDIRQRIMEGRCRGKAVFPKLAANPPSTQSHKTWWDPIHKKARRALSDGTLVESTSVEEGPSGFIVAQFDEGPAFETELTNDLIHELEPAVIDPAMLRKKSATLKRPASAPGRSTEGQSIGQLGGAFSKAYWGEFRRLIGTGMSRDEAKQLAKDAGQAAVRTLPACLRRLQSILDHPSHN